MKSRKKQNADVPPSHGMSHVKNQISIAKGYEDTAWKRFSSSRSQGPGQKSNRQRNRLLHTYPPPKGMSHEKYQIPTTNGSGDIAWTRFSCSRSQDPGERSNQKKKKMLLQTYPQGDIT